ncbi:zinc transporter ZntB [Kordiimonas aquimaris]|uniref:zinc transporter ZntB n=1 Tax=Kordiimonas aquimaris TaxID=707591 RepID=UPI0021D149E4|nr:zinc transporter ZntB [Kordiimonas aquimaris]
MSDHILLSYAFDGAGGAKVLDNEEASKAAADEQIAWVHLDANHPDTKVWLDSEISYLDPFIAEALLAEETSPRMTQIGDGALIILRGVNLNEDAKPEDMVSIRMWVDSHRIISVRKRKLRAVRDIEEKLRAGHGPKNAAEFVCMLTASMFNRFEPVLTTLDDATDTIEEEVLEDASTNQRERIVGVRKQAIVFRRYMAPQRDAIMQMHGSELSWLTDKSRRHLQESYSRVKRYVDDLDAIRERAQIVKDELANILADRLNKNMYVLSVIAAIFLPLGFLTGLLGINIGGIPGSENENAFLLFSGGLIVLVVAQVVIFKKLKWF